LGRYGLWQEKKLNTVTVEMATGWLAGWLAGPAPPPGSLGSGTHVRLPGATGLLGLFFTSGPPPAYY
jgi:hypothetical protein